MTPSVGNSPGTAIDLLFGPGQGAPEALARQILSAGADANLDRAVMNLSSATRQAAVREVATQAAGLLDIDLTGLLLAGWRTHHDLTTAARRTLATPGSSELLDLVTHQITVSQQPFVTIDVGERRVATVKLGLTGEFDIGAVVAGIKAGLLVALHAGHCDTTATLAIQEIDVLTRHARFELPGVIPVSPRGPAAAGGRLPSGPGAGPGARSLGQLAAQIPPSTGMTAPVT